MGIYKLLYQFLSILYYIKPLNSDLWGFDQLAVTVLKNMKPDALDKKLTDFAVLIQDSKLLTSKPLVCF